MQTRRDFLLEAEVGVVAKGIFCCLEVGRPCQRDATFGKGGGICSGQKIWLLLTSGAAVQTRRDYLSEADAVVVARGYDFCLEVGRP